MYKIQNIQGNNNVVLINPKQLVLSQSRQKDTLEIERREKNTYYNKIISINNKKNYESILQKCDRSSPRPERTAGNLIRAL